MPLHRTLAAGAAAAVAISLGAQAAHAAATPRSLVIHETFTTLPCTGRPANRNTLQLEGCAEHRVLALDRRIDALNAGTYAKLASRTGRRDFIAANTSWLTFRLSACLGAASNYSGGTLVGVVYANCLASIDAAHVGELHALARALSPSG